MFGPRNQKGGSETGTALLLLESSNSTVAAKIIQFTGSE
jgi:hypothetical protein